MARIVWPIMALGIAVAVAALFGTIAHDAFDVARDTIRDEALASAAFISVAMAGAVLLRRDK